MATTIPESASRPVSRQSMQGAPSFGATVRRVLKPLASLKLTVGLFAMALFIVLVGTLAQVQMDVWPAVGEYFRIRPGDLFRANFPWINLGALFVWVDFQLFFPPSFFPSQPQIPGGIYFPKGWSIGGLMALNLLAAHGVRFTLQARGTRLYAGLAVIAVGIATTVLVILSGNNTDGLQGRPVLEWDTLWGLFLFGLGLAWLTALFGLTQLDRGQTVERGLLTGVGVLLGGLLLLLLFWQLSYDGEAARLNDSAMRILWQLMKGGFAAGILLFGCWLAFKKRAGIVLLHAGVGLMMLGEVMVGLQAVEAKMTINEGEVTNYSQDIRSLELAVIAPSGPEEDEKTEVVVPESRLLGGQRIEHEKLPFDVELVEFMKNSTLRRAESKDDNPADAGAGRAWIAKEIRPGTGTDAEAKVDASSAYVRLYPKDGDEPLGTYLVSLHLRPQPVTVAGKTYDVALRFKRDYKPYSVYLEDVRKKDYPGTTTPQDYSSFIRLIDPKHGVEFEKRIWMNNPLRYAGETFYQSDYGMEQDGTEYTSLQVVANQGWMIPYVGCMVVMFGLLFQFGGVLGRFLNRASSKAAAVTSEPSAEQQETSGQPAGNASSKKSPKRHKPKARQAPPAPATQQSGFLRGTVILPLIVVVVFGGWVVSLAVPPSTPAGEMDLHAFGKIPVIQDGRAKPIDTMARSFLRMISGRESFVDANGKKQPAIRWVLDAMAKPRQALEHRVFRIDNLELLDILELQPRPSGSQDSRAEAWRYSFAEFRDKLPELQKQAEAARKAGEKATLAQSKALELEQKIGIVDLLFQSFHPPQIRRESARDDLMKAISRQRQLVQRKPGPPLIVPPNSEDGEWRTYAMAWMFELLGSVRDEETNPAFESLGNILTAYIEGDAKTFNKEVAEYRASLHSDPPPQADMTAVNFEAYYNDFAPTYWPMWLYVGAFVLVGLGWLATPAGYERPLQWSAFWLLVLAFLVHTFGLIARMYISGRPPVTNLYSSAVFIGWGAVLFGAAFEQVVRYLSGKTMGIGNAIAAVGGFATLMIAHNLAREGDTFTVLQAVLDTQFWLSTHVVCITLGYTTTYVAGLLGGLYILGGLLTPALNTKLGTESTGKTLARMIYGTLCFALFFSFVGTVLGGLWADDSWGRFWGWDPKENGALIIVIWNALILHARWGGMVKERGLAVLAAAGMLCVTWSWFGTNMLGIGLHAYGAQEGQVFAFKLGMVMLAGLVVLGCLPRDLWMSFRRRTAEA